MDLKREKRIQTFENKCLMRLLWISYRQHKTNSFVQSTCRTQGTHICNTGLVMWPSTRPYPRLSFKIPWRAGDSAVVRGRSGLVVLWRPVYLLHYRTKQVWMAGLSDANLSHVLLPATGTIQGTSDCIQVQSLRVIPPENICSNYSNGAVTLFTENIVTIPRLSTKRSAQTKQTR